MYYFFLLNKHKENFYSSSKSIDIHKNSLNIKLPIVLFILHYFSYVINYLHYLNSLLNK